MNAKKTLMGWIKIIVCLMFFITVIFILSPTVVEQKKSWWTNVREELEQVMEREIIGTHLPVFLYVETDYNLAEISRSILLENTPVLQSIKDEQKIVVATQSDHAIDEIIRSEGSDEDNDYSQDLSMKQDSEGILHLSNDMQEHLKEENELAKNDGEEKDGEEEKSDLFVAANEKQQEYQWDYYSTMDNIVKDFYAIDSTTN